MSIDYVALKAELVAGHPVTGAYNVDDQLAANEINELNIEREKLTTSREAQDATDAGEFNALATESDKALWVSALAWESMDLNRGIGLATAQGIWAGAAGTITRPALIATRTEMISRVAELNLGRAVLNAGQINHARTL